MLRPGAGRSLARQAQARRYLRHLGPNGGEGTGHVHSFRWWTPSLSTYRAWPARSARRTGLLRPVEASVEGVMGAIFGLLRICLAHPASHRALSETEADWRHEAEASQSRYGRSL